AARTDRGSVRAALPAPAEGPPLRGLNLCYVARSRASVARRGDPVMQPSPADEPSSPFLDPAYMDDPYPRLARIRTEDPVHFLAPLGLWVILRHDDVKRLFNDTDVVTPDRRRWEHYQPSPEGSYLRWIEDHSLFAIAPEEHGRLRRLFAVALTPRAVKRYE